MKKNIVFLLIMTCFGCSVEKKQQWVDSFECSSSNTNITPQMVEKSPGRYIGDCFTWYGKISDIQEVDSGMIWIVDDMEGEYDDNIQYVSTSTFNIQVNNDGNRSYDRYLNYSDIYFSLDTFHYSELTDGIYEDDIVKIEGSVLGIVKKPNPFFEGRYTYTTQFVVYSLVKI